MNRFVPALAAVLMASVLLNVFAITQMLRAESDIHDLKTRQAQLEYRLQRREHADPLAASECRMEAGRGQTRNKPCYITFDRLLQVPEQFHGRWIAVTGMYMGGFETSALYAAGMETSRLRTTPYYSAVWVGGPIRSKEWALTRKTILGKFRNGPSGHLSAYFGRLDHAAEVDEDTVPTHDW